MIVRIPTPLRSYTGQRATVEATGTTVAEVLTDLELHHPGLVFRMVDEQGRLRPHMRVFVGERAIRDLAEVVPDGQTVTIMQALSGG